MKTLYFDLAAGISGDMIVSALMDLGVSLKVLKRELSRLGFKGYALKLASIQRGHAKALKFDVVPQRSQNFSYQQIVRLISRSRLNAGTKQRALRVYETLKKAEEKVHGRSADMHFHQLGEVDSILDIVSASICLEALGVRDILYSVIPLSLKTSGAVSRMLEGNRVCFKDWGFENVTPTGMAFLKALGHQVGENQERAFVYGNCGCGAGTADPADVDNILRVIELKEQKANIDSDEILVLDANIDDLNPQVFSHVFDRLLEAGAMDVFVRPVLMKKTRPGFLLTVLSSEANFDKITGIILQETTTIGLRYYPVRRLKLERRLRKVKVLGKTVRMKSVMLPDGSERSVPEYEDCLALAKKSGRPLLTIMEMAKNIADKA